MEQAQYHIQIRKPNGDELVSGESKTDETPLEAATRIYRSLNPRRRDVRIGLVNSPISGINLWHVQFTSGKIGALDPTVVIKAEEL